FTFQFVVVKKNKQVNLQMSLLVEQEFNQYEQALRELASQPQIQQAFSEPSLLWQVNDLLYLTRNKRMFKANFALLDTQGHVITTSLYDANIRALSSSYIIKDLLRQPHVQPIQRT